MKSRYIVIRDEHSKLFGHRILNAQLSLYIGLVQLLVCLWALSQHIWSMFTFQKILHCDFSPNSTLPPLLTHVDAIIFDIGLFHHLWGITGCVAQHLDGGYGRFLWCIVHTSALCSCLPFAFISRPKPQWLWPLLIQQSAYGVGMLILSLAALPKAAHMLGDLQNAPLRAIAFYTFGTMLNFFLLYVYWHWYWHVESLWNSARRLRRGETFTKSERRPIRKITCELPSLPQNGPPNGPPIAPKSSVPPANGHLPPEKKQMSVTILEHPGGPSPMPITRIEPPNGQLAHSQANSKSTPNGRCTILVGAEMENRQNKKSGGGKRPPKLRKDGPGAGASIESNTSASTATFSTTTTLPAANLAANRCPPTAPELPQTLRPPPSPAPPASFPEEACLPPRVRHLRKEEGRPKSPRKCSNSTMASSRRESSNSGGSASTSAPESRKSSYDDPMPSAIIDPKGNVPLLPPLCPRFSMPNGHLPPKSRQLSLRQRRRLSLRQRNHQMAARKQQMEERGPSNVPLLLSRSSLPLIERPNGATIYSPYPSKGPSPSFVPSPYIPPANVPPFPQPPSNHFWPPNRAPPLQATAWSSADRFFGAKPFGGGGGGGGNWHSPWAESNGQMPALAIGNGIGPNSMATNNFHPQLANNAWKRPLEGPLSSLPLIGGNGGGWGQQNGGGGSAGALWGKGSNCRRIGQQHPMPPKGMPPPSPLRQLMI